MRLSIPPKSQSLTSKSWDAVAILAPALSMANAGPNTNGSQFFIMHGDYALPPLYTKFGQVIEGQDIVDQIAQVRVNDRDKPLEAVVMEKVTING